MNRATPDLGQEDAEHGPPHSSRAWFCPWDLVGEPRAEGGAREPEHSSLQSEIHARRSEGWGTMEFSFLPHGMDRLFVEPEVTGLSAANMWSKSSAPGTWWRTWWPAVRWCGRCCPGPTPNPPWHRCGRPGEGAPIVWCVRGGPTQDHHQRLGSLFDVDASEPHESCSKKSPCQRTLLPKILPAEKRGKPCRHHSQNRRAPTNRTNQEEYRDHETGTPGPRSTAPPTEAPRTLAKRPFGRKIRAGKWEGRESLPLPIRFVCFVCSLGAPEKSNGGIWALPAA